MEGDAKFEESVKNIVAALRELRLERHDGQLVMDMRGGLALSLRTLETKPVEKRHRDVLALKR